VTRLSNANFALPVDVIQLYRGVGRFFSCCNALFDPNSTIQTIGFLVWRTLVGWIRQMTMGPVIKVTDIPEFDNSPDNR
ncbi:uncharacterized protein METZ01_LOCUS139564, partial [marine metagenome]